MPPRVKLPKLALLMDDAETDVLAYVTFPAPHRAKLHSTNLERLNGEIKRRTDVVGIFPNEAAITRLVGANPSCVADRSIATSCFAVLTASASGRRGRSPSPWCCRGAALAAPRH